MGVIEESVDVAAPVRAAYNQWTQFESFPRFVPGVKDVEQLGPALVRWVTGWGPVTHEFDAEIVEQAPDERVLWQSLDGPHHTGSVTFRPTADDRTRVTLRMEYAPHGPVGRTVDALGGVRRGIHGGLGQFKAFVESREEETGAWRGAISGGHVRPGRLRPAVPCWPSG